ADDGIRDFHVTGVQTCALPIYIATRISAARTTTWAPRPFPAVMTTTASRLVSASSSDHPIPIRREMPVAPPPAFFVSGVCLQRRIVRKMLRERGRPCGKLRPAVPPVLLVAEAQVDVAQGSGQREVTAMQLLAG